MTIRTSIIGASFAKAAYLPALAIIDDVELVAISSAHLENAQSTAQAFNIPHAYDDWRTMLDKHPVDLVGIATPTIYHAEMALAALDAGAHVICEKPLVINTWNLQSLSELEAKTGKREFTILQLRLHPTLIALQQQLTSQPAGQKRDVVLTYITRRGQWYHTSWKGDDEKSGGLAMNIGIHFFDLLIWLFGKPQNSQVHLSRPDKMAGSLELEGAKVRWYLSVDVNDLPQEMRDKGKYASRSITMDGQEIEFSEGFTDLHTRVYEQTLAGNGFGIEDARPSIELVYDIRHADLTPKPENLHPMLLK